MVQPKRLLTIKKKKAKKDFSIVLFSTHTKKIAKSVLSSIIK